VAVLDLRETLDRLAVGLALSAEDLARATGTSTATVKRWRAGSHLPQGESRQRLDGLWDLKERLDESFTNAAAAKRWLSGRSRYLGGFTPKDALLLGHVERVNAALEALDSGIFL